MRLGNIMLNWKRQGTRSGRVVLMYCSVLAGGAYIVLARYQYTDTLHNTNAGLDTQHIIHTNTRHNSNAEFNTGHNNITLSKHR